jgi:hypothetical protein
MKTEQRCQRILTLLVHLSGLGIKADLYALSIIELRGLYAFLLRVAGE